MESFLRFLYHVDPPKRVRDRPMEVLALGLSRSGTESLRLALKELGYDETYHGFLYASDGGDAYAWYPLLSQKLRPKRDQKPLADYSPAELREIFDKIMGNCAAITDTPATLFAPELLKAYPEAKVILNRRYDLDAWERSISTTLIARTKSWTPWILRFFDRELFWYRKDGELMFKDYFHGSFEYHGKQVYLDHYHSLEKILENSDSTVSSSSSNDNANNGRPYLNWSVDDGWAPLCDFLDKKNPADTSMTPFPNGNGPGAFEERVKAINMKRVARAKRNIVVVVLLGAAAATAAVLVTV